MKVKRAEKPEVGATPPAQRDDRATALDLPEG